MDYLVWIIPVALIVLIGGWLVSTQRSLAALDENINNAMSQIGVLLSSRFDALTALLDLTKGYAEHEYKTISDAIKSRRTMITADSTAAEAKAQENLITEALGRINAVAEAYPELKANENYKETMNAVNQYEQSVRQGRLVYNDSVTKLNRKIRMFPTSIVAGMLGFSKRDYLEADSSKADMPSMK